MAQGGPSLRRKMMPPQRESIDPDQPYPMNLPRLGHAVIVNNVASEMQGSQKDVAALKAAYETIGFDVRVYNDCSAQQMRKVRKWIMAEENHVDSNCFALTIICHGNEKGHLLDKNRSLAWMTELFVADLSDVETLVGKPKIITIQACRGLQYSEGKAVSAASLADGDDLEKTHILPDKADMFLAYATVPGYRADAGTEDGSIYLQALAKYLQQEYMRRPLDKILKMVRQHMIRKVQGTSGMKQCPEERNSLIYDVMFSEFHQKGSSFPQKFTLAQQEEIEKQKKKLEEEKEEFKKQTEAAMKKKIRETEEERKAMEAKMSDRIQELETKMKQMKTDGTPVEKEEFKKKERAKATGIRQTEEESREMETNVSGRIQELEAKMRQIETTAPQTTTGPKSQPFPQPLVKESTDIEHFKSRDEACRNEKTEAWKLYSAGSYDEALVKAQQALEIEEKEFGARDEQMVELYRLLATIWVQKDSATGTFLKENLLILHEAIIYSEKAMTIYSRLPQKQENMGSLAWLLNYYVYALTEWSQSGGDDRLSAQDALDKATSAIEEMITIAQQINDMELLAGAYMKKGDIHEGEEEAKWYREALRIATEHFGEKDELCGVIYYNTGVHHEQQGELQEAYKNYKQSYLICEEVRGYKHPKTQKRLRTLREDRYVQIAKQRGENWLSSLKVKALYDYQAEADDESMCFPSVASVDLHVDDSSTLKE